MMIGGSFYQVLLGVLAKFRSPPIPLIAGVRQPKTAPRDSFSRFLAFYLKIRYV